MLEISGHANAQATKITKNVHVETIQIKTSFWSNFHMVPVDNNNNNNNNTCCVHLQLTNNSNCLI